MKLIAFLRGSLIKINEKYCKKTVKMNQRYTNKIRPYIEKVIFRNLVSTKSSKNRKRRILITRNFHSLKKKPGNHENFNLF